MIQGTSCVQYNIMYLLCYIFYYTYTCICIYFYQGDVPESALVCSDPSHNSSGCSSHDIEGMVSTYIAESNHSGQRMQDICDGVSVCCYSSLSLGDYVLARSEFCSRTHAQPCNICAQLLKVADAILKEGYVTLQEAYRLVSPNAKYDTEKAKRKLLQLPIASIRIGQAASGTAFTILMEYHQSVQYDKLSAMISSLLKRPQATTASIDKSTVQSLLGIAQSDHERQCIRYAVYKASGVTPTQARKQFGFDNMTEKAHQVESCIDSVRAIREAIDDLATTQDEALLATFGIGPDDSAVSSESESSLCSGSLSEIEEFDRPSEEDVLELEEFKQIACSCHFNWFSIVESCPNISEETLAATLNKALHDDGSASFESSNVSLLLQSRDAYHRAILDGYESERIARAVNGEIVTDSEADVSPEDLVGLHVASEKGKLVIQKQRAAIRLRARRLKVRMIAEERFLARKVSKRVSKVQQEHPDIGKTIEDFVSAGSVGADQWRRTGVLTFDGNVKVGKKVTYQSIRQHLEKVYNRHFSYGTVVQLCVPRNKRRRSASRYQGLAKVTTRRARKGFTLKYNPDSHWSAALYKGLYSVQYVDGRNIVNLNRDDASGFRLDTLTTNKQYATPVITNKEILTTRTDYVNKHPSVLQTTSYNFTETKTTVEKCVGVVKAPKIHEKNPSQHAADLNMLCTMDELQSAFINMETNKPKEVDCIRVDGAGDEGPSHVEVQFHWTRYHIMQQKVATLVTTRSSGSSYLNKVELQNGCLSLGHANLFIPSTLNGSCIDPTTGDINTQKLRANLSSAIDVYIDRVDGCPCGSTTIKLYRGTDASEELENRNKLLVFLKGSKNQKDELQKDDPELFQHFQEVWDVRNSHLIHELPTQYIFFLVCCYKESCLHPRCQAGRPSEPLRWYQGGPLITQLPYPVPDPERPWGSTSCPACNNSTQCFGHYKSIFVDVTDKAELKKLQQPPSTMLKRYFSDDDGHTMEYLSEKVLLPIEGCKIWLEHLRTVLENRKRGAQKAAATRKSKKAELIPETVTYTDAESDMDEGENDDHSESLYCATCGEDDGESELQEVWIWCDLCENWYHLSCEGLRAVPTDDTYICVRCQN